MDLRDCRNGLKTALRTVPTLNVQDLRDMPDVPCAMVMPEAPFDFGATFDGSERPTFCILVLVRYTDVLDAQEKMDAFLSTEGAHSIPAVIAANSTLGGLVSACVIKELKSYSVVSLIDGGLRYLSAEIVVELWD